MRSRKWVLPTVVLTALGAGAVGFGASHLRDGRAIERLTAERDLARDCRRSGAAVAPCPVVYRNARIAWRDRIQTVQAPDEKQAERIAVLSAELARARRTIRDFDRRWMRPRVAGTYGWQNGTRQHPYSTDARCPAGSVVVYDAGLSSGGVGGRYPGDPNVCYVLTRLHRLALSLPHR